MEAKNSETQKLRNSETQKLRNSETQKLGNSETRKLRNSRTQKLRNSQTQKLRNSETHFLGSFPKGIPFTHHTFRLESADSQWAGAVSRVVPKEGFTHDTFRVRVGGKPVASGIF